VSKGKPYRGRAIALKAPKKLPRILTPAEMQAVLDACTRLRDRFFFAVLHESGCRAGEALGLRHEDIAAAECEISIVARENANGARAKSGGRTVPVGPDLIRLYADYLHEEYGSALSDYVFINLWAEPKGQAWSYQAAYDLVLRLRARTGIEFDPHWFRHSAATRWLRDGVPIEVVSALLGHSSVAVTSSVYGHLTAEDARAALEKAGWLTGKEVQW
jgi:integrase